MTGLVLMPDLLLWASGFVHRELELRSESYAADVVVTTIEPPVDERDFPRRLVVIGDSGNTDGDLHLAEASLRVSTLAGSPENPQECNDLARLVHAIVRSSARVEPGNPVAAVVASRGPMSVPEAHPRARRLSTFDLSIVGAALP